MDEQNPYRNPTSQVAEVIADGNELDLADRGTRLGAAIIDVLILTVILLPVMWVGGYFAAAMEAGRSGTALSFGTTLLWSLIGFVVFVVVQGFPLNQSGQTWGKRLLKIRIVDLNGNKPPFLQLIALRYLPIQLISQVPVVGFLIALANPLFIFRADKRCIHDLIAGTRVINAR